MNKQIAFLPIVAILACSLDVADAEDVVLYDNGIENFRDIDRFGLGDYDNSSLGIQVLRADDFVIPGNSVLTGVSWTGVYDPIGLPPDDDFEIAFYAGVDSPDDAPFLAFDLVNLTRVDTGLDFGILDLYAYSAEFDAIDWPDSSTYWVSIRNRTFGFEDDWFWSGMTANDGNSHFMNDGGSWDASDIRLDFQLIGKVIPEPSSTALLGVCLVARWMRRRRWSFPRRI